MGQTLAKLNEMKTNMNNTMAFMKGQEPETGYLGSPCIKFPRTALPAGCQNLDIRVSYAKIPEILKIAIFECVDEFKNDGSYRFSGAEISWRDKKTGNIFREEKMCGEKDGCRLIEIGSLDYVKKIILSTKEHQGQKYISFCGVQSHLAEPAGAGDLKLPVNTIGSTNTSNVEGMLGLRLVVHKKLKVIVDVIPFFARVADKKTKVDKTREAVSSFFTSSKEVLPIYGTKIYTYKAPENKYEDFSTYITNGEMKKEYLGGLPLKFLSPEEGDRFAALVTRLSLGPLLELIRNKGSVHHLKLEPAMEDKVVNFVVAVLEQELFSEAGSYEENIRFCMKMLCIVYNDDEKLWKRIQEKVGANYKDLGGRLFEKAMNTLQNDNNLKEVQKIENFQDDAVKTKYQKACPQCPDDGKETDVEKIAKKYMMDAAQYIGEFHALFQSLFTPKKYKSFMDMTKKDTEYHGAPTVKGIDRIKAKAMEYQEKEKLSASDAIARTMDYLRGTVECANLHEVIMAFHKIKKLKGDFKIVRIKNGFQNMTEKGYKSILLNIMIYNTQIAEVQITIGAFKEGNTLNHFIYEVLREHNLYDMVSKNLNLGTAFKEWLEPVADSSRYEIWPRNQNIHLKGYCLEGGTDFWSALEIDPKKRLHCSMNFTTNKDYGLTGHFAWPYGNFKLREGECKVKFPADSKNAAKNTAEVIGGFDSKAGQTVSNIINFGKTLKDTADKANAFLSGEKDKVDPNTPTIELKMYSWGESRLRGYVGKFTGKFVDDQIIEGSYVWTPCDTMGKEKTNTTGQFGVGSAEKKGTFRFWVDDSELPGLNVTSLAFRDIMKTSRVVRKRFIPSKLMEWKGSLGGSGKGDANEPISLKMKVSNPNNFPYTTGMEGKGKIGTKSLQYVSGFHRNYDSVKLTLQLGAGSGGCFSFAGPKGYVCTGMFLEDLKIAGIYEQQSHRGRFEIECVDKDAVKKFGSKSESSDDRWDLIIVYNDGEKQYNQLTMKINPTDKTIKGSGFNYTGTFQISGKQENRDISITRVQKDASGAEESLVFDGMFITGGLYEGLFRSVNDWGKFKLKAC